MTSQGKRKATTSWFGCMKGEMEIVGDIVGPIGALDDWTLDEGDGIWDEEPVETQGPSRKD